MAILKTKQRPGHAAGIYSDMTLDGPEIGTLVVVVDRAKNLPNRRAIGKQDPYCAMRLAKEAKKTHTDRRGGQTPRWDQEIRFTVHDSPDYYKLKCSIFNDDKKTELIGEAWVDLSEVIRLGGGQRDFWQQLNFKGKYAGDIRIELTFYDTREQPAPESKRRKERPQTASNDSGIDLTLPAQRSLGPREIQRRPLPMNPAGTPPQPDMQTYNDNNAPRRPPKVPFSEEQEQEQQYQPIHAPVPVRPRDRSPSPMFDGQQQEPCYEDSHHFATEDYDQSLQSAVSQRRQSYPYDQPQPWQLPLGQQHLDLQSNRYPRISQVPQGQESQNDFYSSVENDVSYMEEQQTRQPHRPQSMHTYSDPITPLHSSSLARPSPATANSDSQLVRQHQHRLSDVDAYSYGNPTHGESPLKQSMTHMGFDTTGAATEQAPPPLPPKHKDTPPRRSRTDYPPSAYMPQPLRTGPQRTSISDRSPLQSLEDVYDPHTQVQRHSQPQTPERHSMYVQLPSQHPITPEQALDHYGRRNTTNTQPAHAGASGTYQRPSTGSRRTSYEIRHPSLDQQIVSEPMPMTPRDDYSQQHEDSYQPTVEDAPPSPGLQPIISRKAVGAQPKRLNGVPFGPDAYDVLNPSSSPVTNERTEFETPEQAKESARLREVEKARDLGPIIGNDGREIDPSDHLPSDTWAPEPERKQRKPEHVIHIRSKNDANRPSGARASPVVIRNRGSATASAQSTPVPATPESAPASSPAARSGPSSFIGGRNRLQKATPGQARPLPNQPYASPMTAAVSSPALQSSPSETQNFVQQRPLQPRRPSHENRVPPHLHRPSRSEYQVPVGSTQNVRSNSYDPYQSPMKPMNNVSYETPTRQAPQSYSGGYSAPNVQDDRRRSFDNRRQSYDRRNSYDNRSDYSYENHVEGQRPQGQPYHSNQQQQQQQVHFDDPLAAEMSLIDIGPSRHSYHQGSMGRSMVRSGGRW